MQETWQWRSNGERYWCQRLVVSRSDGEGTSPSSLLVVLRDVPRHEAAGTDIRRLLTSDHLTGVANRMHFSQTLEQSHAMWQKTGYPLSIVVLDLDHFKTVNDTYGHPVGDILLQRVAQACTAILPYQALFARLGGEEFAALLPKCPLREAVQQAEKFRLAIADLEVPAADGMIKVTASLACATLDEADGSVDAMIKLADQRLYEAKRGGRNRVYQPAAVAA